MKKFTVVETAIIGGFIGVIVAAFLTFQASTDGFIGNIIGWISLQPLIGFLHFPENLTLAFSFIFFVLVYMIYGTIIGLFIKKVNRPFTVAAALILVVLAAGTEQILVSKQLANIPDISYEQTAAVISAIPIAKRTAQTQATTTEPQQYFGMEATGDLNTDGVDDVAFIIHRSDKTVVSAYYLAAAIASTTGHIGSNLLFLGDKITPQDISIANGIITIDYTQKTATTTHQLYAQLTDGNLTWIKTPPTVAPVI